MFFNSTKQIIKDKFPDAVSSLSEVGATLSYLKKECLYIININGMTLKKTEEEMKNYNIKLKAQRGGNLKKL